MSPASEDTRIAVKALQNVLASERCEGRSTEPSVPAAGGVPGRVKPSAATNTKLRIFDRELFSVAGDDRVTVDPPRGPDRCYLGGSQPGRPVVRGSNLPVDRSAILWSRESSEIRRMIEDISPGSGRSQAASGPRDQLARLQPVVQCDRRALDRFDGELQRQRPLGTGKSFPRSS